MAEQKHLWYDEDVDLCQSCGQSRYVPSKTAGLCIECNPADPKYIGADNDQW